MITDSKELAKIYADGCAIMVVAGAVDFIARDSLAMFWRLRRLRKWVRREIVDDGGMESGRPWERGWFLIVSLSDYLTSTYREISYFELRVWDSMTFCLTSTYTIVNWEHLLSFSKLSSNFGIYEVCRATLSWTRICTQSPSTITPINISWNKIMVIQ